MKGLYTRNVWFHSLLWHFWYSVLQYHSISGLHRCSLSSRDNYWEHVGSYRLVALQKFADFLWYIKTYHKCSLRMRMTYVSVILVLLKYKSIVYFSHRGERWFLYRAYNLSRICRDFVEIWAIFNQSSSERSLALVSILSIYSTFQKP